MAHTQGMGNNTKDIARKHIALARKFKLQELAFVFVPLLGMKYIYILSLSFHLYLSPSLKKFITKECCE